LITIATDKTMVGPWIAQQCAMIWRPEGTEAIGLVSDGKIVAGVWYEDWNPCSIITHIAIAGRITRRFLRVIFDYPFNQLGVQKIIAPVLAANAKSIQLVEKLGFREETRIKDMHPTGDMIFFVIDKQNCKYLEDRYGKI